MPDAPQGLAVFPGVKQIESYQGTLSLGITPSVHRLTFAPQPGFIGATGDLLLVYGGTSMVLKDCQVDSATYHFNEQGYLVSFSIMDRRWKWRYGHISGFYNTKREDGSIIDGKGADPKADAIQNTERTPQQLAKLCLDAMGETGYDVSQLPDKARPTVEWELENPAQALAELCDLFACRVALGLDNKVRLCRTGIGQQMPDGPIMDDQFTANPPERPSKIICFTAPVGYQVDWELEAVGLDRDGKIKPIAQLSYIPGDISKLTPPGFHGITNAENLALARATLYRWYRLKVPFTIGGVKITNLKQVLPLDDSQLTIDPDTKERLPGLVYGIFSGERSTKVAATGNNAAAAAFLPLADMKSELLYRQPFTIDRERGIVQFGSPVYRYLGAGCAAALLRLRITVHVREPKTGEFYRWKRERTPAGKGKPPETPPMVLRHDDILPGYTISYDNKFQEKGVQSNIDAVNQECDYYLDAAEAEMQLENPAVRTFAGWLAIQPDGALQSISWQCDQSGATMTVSRNQDLGTPTTIPYKERRFLEKQKASDKPEDKKAALLAAKLKRTAKIK